MSWMKSYEWAIHLIQDILQYASGLASGLFVLPMNHETALQWKSQLIGDSFSGSVVVVSNVEVWLNTLSFGTSCPKS